MGVCVLCWLLGGVVVLCVKGQGKGCGHSGVCAVISALFIH